MKLKRKIDAPEFFQLSLKPTNFIILILNPDDKISIKANSKNLANSYAIEGSESSSQIKELTTHLTQTRYSLDSIQNIVNSEYRKPAFDKDYTRLNEEFIKIVKNQRNFSI